LFVRPITVGAMAELIDIGALERVIRAATKVAIEYRRVTGKPLGITGEVGEFHAAHLLGWQLAEARQAGYDAIASDGHRVQVKARCVLAGASPSQRVGSIKLDHPWETVALVLMDGDFAPVAIYEAQRADIERELTKPGSRSRNDWGALSVSKFKSVASLLWPTTNEARVSVESTP
jgi:hypothetical protein